MHKRKLYVAGRFSSGRRISTIANDLNEAGLDVVSTWHSCGRRGGNPSLWKHCAKMDLSEIETADAFLAIMDDPSYAYRGTFTEMGFAIANKKTVVIVSPATHTEYTGLYVASNAFFWHPTVLHATTIDEAVDIINMVPLKSR